MAEENMVTTPVEGTSVGNTDTETVQTETVITETKTEDNTNRDFTAELTSKDNEIATLRRQVEDAATDKATREKLALELSNAITARHTLAGERDAALQSRSEAIESMTTATTSLLDHDGRLQARIADYEKQIREEKATSSQRLAKLTKLEVLTKEFSHLLPYADRIRDSEDEDAVRADAKAFAETREADLDAYRRAVGGNLLQQVTESSQSTTSEENALPDDSDARMNALRANYDDPRKFEAALNQMKQAYEAQRGLAG